jgi:uncharacterized membrane protein
LVFRQASPLAAGSYLAYGPGSGAGLLGYGGNRMKVTATNLGTIERALSGLVGAFLFKKSNDAAGWARLPLALLGGLAVSRAVSGHSRVYSSLGISSAEGVNRLLHPELPAPPALPLVQSATVNKPKEEVYKKLLALPEEALPKEEIIALHRDGTKLRLWLEEGGGMREYELSLTREIEGRELAFRARASDRIPAGEIHLSDASDLPGATLVTIFLERKQSWLQNIGSAIGVDHDQKVVVKYLGYLKALLEEGSISAEGSAHVPEGEIAEARKQTDYH